MEVISIGSVLVSWNRIAIPEITSYIVYYRKSSRGNEECSVTVPSSDNSVIVVLDLTHTAEYQFQVVAVAELEGGGVVMGQRSMVTRILLHTSGSATSATS